MNRTGRMRHEAHSLVERGRHRAEGLRAALPEPGEVVAGLRDQAAPAVDVAKERAARATHRKRARSKKPLLLILLAITGALVAYVVFSKRGHEPARLASEPRQPGAAPAGEPPGAYAGANGGSPVAPSVSPAPGETPGETPAETPGEEVPEQASAHMEAPPAQGAQSSEDVSPPAPSASTYRPQPQAATWDAR